MTETNISATKVLSNDLSTSRAIKQAIVNVFFFLNAAAAAQHPTIQTFLIKIVKKWFSPFFQVAYEKERKKS